MLWWNTRRRYRTNPPRIPIITPILHLSHRPMDFDHWSTPAYSDSKLTQVHICIQDTKTNNCELGTCTTTSTMSEQFLRAETPGGALSRNLHDIGTGPSSATRDIDATGTPSLHQISPIRPAPAHAAPGYSRNGTVDSSFATDRSDDGTLNAEQERMLIGVINVVLKSRPSTPLQMESLD